MGRSRRGSGSVFQRTYRDAKGKNRKTANWYIEFVAANRTIREPTDFTNRTDAAEFLKKRMSDALGGKVVLSAQQRRSKEGYGPVLYRSADSGNTWEPSDEGITIAGVRTKATVHRVIAIFAQQRQSELDDSWQIHHGRATHRDRCVP